MKSYIVLLSALICGTSLPAQQLTPTFSITNTELGYRDLMLQSHSRLAKHVKDFGEMGGEKRYFSTNWTTGSATNPSDAVISSPYEFNFDFQEQELYARWKDTMIVVNSNYLKSFSLVNNGVTHYFVRASNIHPTGFVESIGYNPGKNGQSVQLLKLRTIKVKPADKNSYVANFNGDYSDQFVNKIEYYIVLPDNTSTQVKLTRKSMLAALPAYKNKVEAFFEANESVTEDNIGRLIEAIN